MKATPLRIGLLAALAAAATLDAGETPPALAAKAASAWMNGRPAAGTVRTYSAKGKTLFHVVDMEGGGFVVMAGDTERNPVIAFSGSGKFAAVPGDPVYDLLLRDVPRRGKSAAAPAEWKNLAESPAKDYDHGTESILDVRVAPFVNPRWGQTHFGFSEAFNL